MEHGDAEAIARLGHKMKGEGGSYGLDAVTDLGRELEQAGKDSDFDAARRLGRDLTNFLERSNRLPPDRRLIFTFSLFAFTPRDPLTPSPCPRKLRVTDVDLVPSLSKERVRERFDDRFSRAARNACAPAEFRLTSPAARDARGGLSLDKERL